jgi:hypothetical protein
MMTSIMELSESAGFIPYEDKVRWRIRAENLKCCHVLSYCSAALASIFHFVLGTTIEMRNLISRHFFSLS